MADIFDRRESRLTFHAIAATAFILAASPTLPLMAQGLDSEEAIDTIVGAEVATGEKSIGEEQARVVAAVEQSIANATEVRKRFNLEQVEIVFLPELGSEETTALDGTIEENRDAIEELRRAIEGSAIFYHAIDSRSILLRNIVAIEFDDADNVTIFVAGADTTP